MARRTMLALTVCLMMAATIECVTAGYTRWSSYVPPPVGRSCPNADKEGKVPHGMWGCDGEAWNAAGPLSDWSFAGYAAGMAGIPSAAPAVDVKRDFRAVGDGRADDTAAVRAALAKTKSSGGVIYFPPGKYLLSGQLVLDSNQVLRGAGRDASKLYFTKSMNDLFGWGSSGYQAGKANSPYTWLGALISTQRTHKLTGDDMYLGKVTRPAFRGQRRLFVDFSGTRYAGKPANEVFIPGQWMALRMYENQNTDLAKSLMNYRGAVGSKVAPMFKDKMVFTHSSRVLAAGSDWVDMERPLYADVQLHFKPLLYRSPNFKVTGVGIEDLTVEFPWTHYPGHHEEKGYNAIEFEAAVNSWIRRVRILNADAGIKIYASMFNTISDVQISNYPSRRSGGTWQGKKTVVDKDGHMAIALHWASFDNLVERFSITGSYYHELLVAGYSAYNVFTSGSGTDLTLDHHGGVPHNNLWTNIDVGTGWSAMDWSGDPQHFPFGGSNNVFWNVYASGIPVPAGASNQRLARRSVRIHGQDSTYNRPAYMQGWGQIVVDMPVDPNSRYIREAGDWFVSYDPARPVYPSDLFKAMRESQGARLQLAPGARTPPALFAVRPVPA